MLSLVIFSLLAFLVFVTLLLMSLNYMVFLWENKQVNDLANKIKHNGDSSLTSKSPGGFSTKDKRPLLGKSFSRKRNNQTRSIQAANNTDRKVVFLDDSKQPEWLKSVLKFFQNLRKSFWVQLISLIKSIFRLSQPIQESEVEVEVIAKQEEEKREVEEVVQKVKEANQDNSQSVVTVQSKQNNEQDQDLSSDKAQAIIQNGQKDESQGQITNRDKERAEDHKATIDLLSGNRELSEAEMTGFQKLEDKVLDKLKSTGLNHYDIWLDLGKLYEKYNQNQKATEIYSMVLKHSQGKEKDLARDRLIAIS